MKKKKVFKEKLEEVAIEGNEIDEDHSLTLFPSFPWGNDGNKVKGSVREDGKRNRERGKKEKRVARWRVHVEKKNKVKKLLRS